LDWEYPIFLSRAQTFSQEAELECMELSYVQADKKAVIGVTAGSLRSVVKNLLSDEILSPAFMMSSLECPS
jgi:hypothetical protein